MTIAERRGDAAALRHRLVEARPHHLEGGEHGADAGAGGAQEAQHLRRAGAADQRRLAQRLRGVELQDAGRHDAEEALRTDEELAQLQPRVVLDEGVHVFEDGAVGEHHLEAQHLVAGHPVAHDVVAAGVGGDHPAELAGAARADVDAEHQAGRRRGLLRGLQHHAGLGDHRAAVRVDRDDPVHPLQRQRDPAGVRVRGAGDARQPALRHHRHAVRGAQPQRLGHLLPVARAQERERLGGRKAGPVVAVFLRHLGAGGDDIDAERVGESFHDIGHHRPSGPARRSEPTAPFSV